MNEEQRHNLVKEARENIANLKNLTMFMMTDDFKKLSFRDKNLIHKQHRIMRKYLQVLAKRIEFVTFDDLR